MPEFSTEDMKMEPYFDLKRQMTPDSGLLGRNNNELPSDSFEDAASGTFQSESNSSKNNKY